MLTLAFVIGCTKDDGKWRAEVQKPEYLHRSIKKITDVIVHDIFSPPVASRIYAYSSVAAYEVAAKGNSKFVSLAGQLNDLGAIPDPPDGESISYEVASVYACLKVGRTLVFSEDKIDQFTQQIRSELEKSGIPSDVLNQSISYGETVAAHIIAWASKDNYKQSRSFPKYTILADPSTWKPTPPAYMDAVEPHWNKIRPIAIDSAAQFKPAPPTPFSTDKKSQFYQEALEVYKMGVEQTEDQSQIAFFWDCNPFVMNVKGHVMFATKKISPGGHWMNITRVACQQAKSDFVTSAEAYARVAISLLDGFISCWDEKYRSKLVRPESYINQYIDENWIPTLQTPPFPEYTSGHSVISSASAAALTGIFGDNFAFTDSTEVEFGLPVRSFTSFKAAASEAAISRMYGGIHYRPAVEVGMTEGSNVGEYIRSNIKTRKE